MDNAEMTSHTVDRPKEIVTKAASAASTASKNNEVNKSKQAQLKKRKSDDAKPSKKNDANEVEKGNCTEKRPKEAITADSSANNGDYIVAAVLPEEPKKSLQEQVRELSQHASLKQIETSAEEHNYQCKAKIITLLQTAHSELHKSTMAQHQAEFSAKYKEMQAQIDEKRRRVMKKLDDACDTDGKVDSDETTGLLQKAVLLLRREATVLEESVRGLIDSHRNNDEEETLDVFLTDNADNKSSYRLASRFMQDDGEVLEMYEKE